MHPGLERLKSVSVEKERTRERVIVSRSNGDERIGECSVSPFLECRKVDFFSILDTNKLNLRP